MIKTQGKIYNFKFLKFLVTKAASVPRELYTVLRDAGVKLEHIYFSLLEWLVMAETPKNIYIECEYKPSKIYINIHIYKYIFRSNSRGLAPLWPARPDKFINHASRGKSYLTEN